MVMTPEQKWAQAEEISKDLPLGSLTTKIPDDLWEHLANNVLTIGSAKRKKRAK